jgi:hypothetical protein
MRRFPDLPRRMLNVLLLRQYQRLCHVRQEKLPPSHNRPVAPFVCRCAGRRMPANETERHDAPDGSTFPVACSVADADTDRKARMKDRWV